jgi:hypothetical protein
MVYETSIKRGVGSNPHTVRDQRSEKLYKQGLGLLAKRDFKSALRVLTAASRLGDHRATRTIGLATEFGFGMRADLSMAIECLSGRSRARESAKWLAAAAHQGLPEALHYFGQKLRLGVGIRKDTRRGFVLALRAARLGLRDAQFSVGVCYSQGIGTRSDTRTAVSWYRRAAEQRYGPAEFNLAFALQHGRGVRHDRNEAMRWYRSAARHGEADALLAVARIWIERGRPKLARYWYSKAQASSDPEVRAAATTENKMVLPVGAPSVRHRHARRR